jgi:hypothetical protein
MEDPDDLLGWLGYKESKEEVSDSESEDEEEIDWGSDSEEEDTEVVSVVVKNQRQYHFPEEVWNIIISYFDVSGTPLFESMRIEGRDFNAALGLPYQYFKYFCAEKALKAIVPHPSWFPSPDATPEQITRCEWYEKQSKSYAARVAVFNAYPKLLSSIPHDIIGITKINMTRKSVGEKKLAMISEYYPNFNPEIVRKGNDAYVIHRLQSVVVNGLQTHGNCYFVTRKRKTMTSHPPTTLLNIGVYCGRGDCYMVTRHGYNFVELAMELGMAPTLNFKR